MKKTTDHNVIANENSFSMIVFNANKDRADAPVMSRLLFATADKSMSITLSGSGSSFNKITSL